MREEKTLGKDCRVYEIAKGKGPEDVKFKTYKIHFYNGILLRKEIDGDVDTDIEAFKKLYQFKEAVDIQFDLPIPKEKFELPADVKVTDMSGLIKELQQNLK